jgi:hypothetical protein
MNKAKLFCLGLGWGGIVGQWFILGFGTRAGFLITLFTVPVLLVGALLPNTN